jgi:membrane glycosyltransferase
MPTDSSVGHRRRLMLALISTTVLAAIALMTWTLSAGGLDWIDLAIIGCFAVTLPWGVLGFWNAVAGLWIMRTSEDPAARVYPGLAAVDDRSPITTRSAILSCIRNEDAGTVSRNLDRMAEELVAAGVAAQFDLHILSDSFWHECIVAEEQAVARLRGRWGDLIEIRYRRRQDNAGFKAGNIREFCERRGADYDYALVLDADSLMSADVLLRMVRTMQQQPRLGILQSLVAGLPSRSAFARPFQFGMRLGMRSFSIGSAWWQADAGPYWGHNALIRLPPFIEHCELPRLEGRGPLSGWVLSHDQVEAALMRRAGYEVRVMPVDDGSWEENPPTLTDFIRRDLRWCQGNLQYFRLLGTPGLLPVSRVQLVIAILMFISSPFWVALTLLGLLRLGLGETSPVYLPGPGLALFAMVMLMVFAPKLASIIDLLLSPIGRRRYGGSARLVGSSIAEAGFSMLLAPIMAIAHCVFMTGLLFGRAMIWGAQRRALHRVTFGEAVRRLWPQTLFGAAAFGWLAAFSPGGALVVSPFFVGALLSVPVAMTSSWPTVGGLSAWIGLWRTPDEVSPSPTVAALGVVPQTPRRRLPALGRPIADAAD